MPFLTKITVWKLLVNKKDRQWKPHLYKICILGLSKKKNRISNISRIFKKNPHSNAKRCIRILGVRQAAYQWRTRCDEDVGRCHCILMLFLTYPVKPTGYVVHSKYCGKREHQSGDVVYVKTETKPFAQNVNVSYFLEGHLSLLHSRLAKESRIFRKRFKIIVSSTLKKHVSQLYGGTGLSPFHCISVFKWKKVTLCDWFSVLCIKLCIYMMLFCF